MELASSSRSVLTRPAATATCAVTMVRPCSPADPSHTSVDVSKAHSESDTLNLSASAMAVDETVDPCFLNCPLLRARTVVAPLFLVKLPCILAKRMPTRMWHDVDRSLFIFSLPILLLQKKIALIKTAIARSSAASPPPPPPPFSLRLV